MSECPDAYGEQWADIYDRCYQFEDGSQAAQFLRSLIDGREWALELGVGTGRIAIPLSQMGVDVVGLDISWAMLRRAATKPAARSVHLVRGDMCRQVGRARFSLVYCALSTLFQLPDVDHQAQALAAARSVLRPGGRLVVEAFVPRERLWADSGPVMLGTTAAGEAVWLSNQHDRRRHLLSSEYRLVGRGETRYHVDFSYLEPAQLDAMAAATRFSLERRVANWRAEPFDDGSDRHVSVYRLATAA